MYKNVAGQFFVVFAWDTAANAPKIGDAANITTRILVAGVGAEQSNDVHPTELDATHMKGLYIFNLTQAESNCNLFVASPVSSTANVQIEPVREYTIPQVADVDVKQIDSDASAAANLKAMLNGTGGVDLTLRNVRIAGNSVDAGLWITNANVAGDGIKVTGGAAGQQLCSNITGTLSTVTTCTTCTTNTDMVGTANAALASVCTAARLGELDPANLPSDVDDVLADTGELQGNQPDPNADPVDGVS